MRFVLACVCEGFFLYICVCVCVWFCVFSTVFLLFCFDFDPWMTEKIECGRVRTVRFVRTDLENLNESVARF